MATTFADRWGVPVQASSGRVHARAHVLEMEGRQRAGLDFLSGTASDWSGSFVAVHNGWHHALCHLELGYPDQGLVLYDGPSR